LQHNIGRQNGLPRCYCLIDMRNILIQLLVLHSLALVLPPAPVTQASERRIYAADAPASLRAIGRLTVPGHDRVDGRRRQRDEHCSATLVSARLVLTAWHCMSHYEDLSRDPVFILPLSPRPERVPARLAASGGGMHADWALLRLARPLTGVAPLLVSQPTALQATPVMIAGYARDDGLGAGGTRLTWQDACGVLAADSGQFSTDCVTFQGASGGPVLAGGNVVGVISRGDSETRTYFVPGRAFFSAVRALRADD
jgi:hypothetical protein